jgi:GT2 family glycosyltransferase
LQSVLAATKEIESEIFVVDNVSTDGTVEEISSRFPQVKLIVNQQNVGFSKANNQAIQLAQGNFVLILNPDTVVAEDTFVKCIAFMLSKPDAGALGVKMIDGTGAFLPESKRGLPTPAVAFYKMFGLASLFPKSKVFGKYHLGYLDENETHEVEILSGAFMFFRKNVLEQIGSFDESFFMYCEDMDLCLRARINGYQIIKVSDSKVKHLGFSSHSEDNNESFDDKRNWHWSWSQIYFYRKHNSKYFFYKIVFKLVFISLIKMVLYFLISRKKYRSYLFKFYGGIISLISLSSFYRSKN